MDDHTKPETDYQRGPAPKAERIVDRRTMQPEEAPPVRPHDGEHPYPLAYESETANVPGYETGGQEFSAADWRAAAEGQARISGHLKDRLRQVAHKKSTYRRCLRQLQRAHDIQKLTAQVRLARVKELVEENMALRIKLQHTRGLLRDEQDAAARAQKPDREPWWGRFFGGSR